INPNGKLFQKLIREGYRYADRLLDYLEDIGTMYIAIRADIREKFIISVESAVIGGKSLFTLEKNKRSSLQNLIQMNYSIDNLTT
ncbi:12834_t:CDS:2, partial [Funneliformis mosseae]